MSTEPLKSFGQVVGGYIEVAMVRGLERYTTSRDSRLGIVQVTERSEVTCEIFKRTLSCL